jgi:hypothetical protein
MVQKIEPLKAVDIFDIGAGSVPGIDQIETDPG